MNKEEFKENLNIDEAIERWNKIFEFEAYPDVFKNSKNISIALEYCLNHLTIDKIMSYDYDDIDVMLPSIIMRIFKNIEEDLSVNYIVDNTRNIVNDFKAVWKNRNNTHKSLLDLGLTNIGFEAEFVADFADNYKLN